MWRLSCLLWLMLFTFDFHRDRVVEAEPVRANAGLDSLDRGQSRRTETRDRPEERDENLAELVGKWRNNGEALEPKWRDGDTVPLLPFSQISPFSGDRADSREEEDVLYRGATKYQQSNGRDNSVRSKNDPRLPQGDYRDYESVEGSREHREREEISPRKRNRPWTGQNTATFEKASNRKEEQSKDLKGDKEATWPHRETFQARPNDYGYEFSDEEYLKPKPRKRRPPQNYEFALTENETSLKTASVDGSQSGSINEKNLPKPTSKTAETLQNAMELKSLLKMQQEEGLSLSEILQRRNLTLNDLLKGKADVINALKMKDSEENEYYNEEAARITPNSFTRLSTTRKPQRTMATEAARAKNSQTDDELVIPISTASPVLRKNRINARGSSESNINSSETYSEATNATTGKSIPASADPARGKVAITTSMPVATNSMELLQADEAAVKSRGNGEIKAEDLEEDEIMEFSDFTDYKKGRSGASPVWLVMKEEQVNGEPPVENSDSRLEDKVSTLSIEKILSPTERSKSANNFSVTSGMGEQMGNKSKKLMDANQDAIIEQSEEDYTTLSEKEYQDDEPRSYYELEHSTQIDNSTDESDAKKSTMREIESALDAVSRDANFTVENRRSSSKGPDAENNENYALKNHQNVSTSEKKSYDDVISEVEPEARAEIFELFASGSAGKRLERLLKSRNMSLEELIALRQRGSSKVHLAEVSRIKAQKSNGEDTNNLKATTTSTPKEELVPSLGRAIGNHDEKYDSGPREYLSQTTENVEHSDSTSNSVNITRPEEITTERVESGINDEISENGEKKENKENQRTVEIVDLLTTFDSLPFAKDIQNFAGEYNDEHQRKLNSNSLGVIFINNDAETIDANDTSNVIHSGFVKEVLKQEPGSTNVQTEYSILGDDENNTENGKTLSKIKPSIIASGAILGVTLVVFLAIFIVCKIQQKQKYRYRSTFSRAVFQGPVLAARKLSNSSSLSNVMVNVVATSTAKRPEKNDVRDPVADVDFKSDIDNDSLDANDSWETIPDYMK